MKDTNPNLFSPRGSQTAARRAATRAFAGSVTGRWRSTPTFTAKAQDVQAQVDRYRKAHPDIPEAWSKTEALARQYGGGLAEADYAEIERRITGSPDWLQGAALGVGRSYYGKGIYTGPRRGLWGKEALLRSGYYRRRHCVLAQFDDNSVKKSLDWHVFPRCHWRFLPGRAP